MDALYYKTDSKEALLSELEVPNDFGRVFESPDNWIIVWVGKLPKSTYMDEDGNGYQIERVEEWHDGEFFNIYLNGQDNMDYFTQRITNASLLKEPHTPNLKLS